MEHKNTRRSGSDRYEIITDHNKFLSLNYHWDNRYERSTEHDVTQSFEWCRLSRERSCPKVAGYIAWSFAHPRAVTGDK